MSKENTNQKTTTFDLILFVAESLASNKKAYKYIDNIYNKKKEKYFTLIQMNPEWNKLKIIKDGSFEQEWYFIKALAILKLQEDKVDIDSIFDMLKKVFKPAYNFIISKKKLVFSDLCVYLTTKHSNLTDDEFNGNLIASMILSLNLGIEYDIEDEHLTVFVNTLQLRLHRYDNPMKLSSKDLEKDEKKRLQNIYLKLKDKYLKRISPCPHVVPPNKQDGAVYKNELFDDIDKFLVPFEYILDNEEIGFLGTVSNIKLKDQDIKDIILTYLYVNKIDNENEVDYKELYKYVVNGINFTYILREYKRTREVLMSTMNMEIKEILESKSAENRELKKTNLQLQDENEKLKRELELLQKKNGILKEDLDSLETSKKELIELRNYIFNMSESDEVHNKFNIADIKDINAVVFGGHPQWITKMKNHVNWQFISTEALNFDVNILNKAEYVFINTSYISHGMYYKVIENIRENNKLKYINNTNIEKCLEGIIEEL